ncbi:Peptidoglycan-N-acetylglucosamine deacetylase [compost metagenome]
MTHSKKILYKSGGSARFIKEFQKEQQLVKNIIGYEPELIRAPYGSKPEIKDKFLDDIADAGFKMWDWTVDSKDWYYAGKPDRILAEVKRQVDQDTEVILMHEKSQTVQILPKVIDYLSNKGYAFAVYKPNQHFPVNFAKDERL